MMLLEVMQQGLTDDLSHLLNKIRRPANRRQVHFYRRRDAAAVWPLGGEGIEESILDREWAFGIVHPSRFRTNGQ